MVFHDALDVMMFQTMSSSAADMGYMQLTSYSAIFDTLYHSVFIVVKLQNDLN